MYVRTFTGLDVLLYLLHNREDKCFTDYEVKLVEADFRSRLFKDYKSRLTKRATNKFDKWHAFDMFYMHMSERRPGPAVEHLVQIIV